MTSDTPKNQMSVYLVFAEPGGQFFQAARSLAGAGAAVIHLAARHYDVVDLALEDGGEFGIDAVDDLLPIDGVVRIRAADGDQPIVRIERRFLAP